jgi:Rrf2 family protein
LKRDSRLSIALHTLLHMAETGGRLTSHEMAERAATHPVVMRRTMAGLREAGIVHSEKGHHGGWALTRDLHDVTLHDVYQALGNPAVFAMGHRSESPGCVVEQAVNRAMAQALEAAEALLVKRLQQVTLAQLAVDVKHGHNARRAPDCRRATRGEKYG